MVFGVGSAEGAAEGFRGAAIVTEGAADVGAAATDGAGVEAGAGTGAGTGAAAIALAGCADLAACCSSGVPCSNCHQSRALSPITARLATALIFQELSFAAGVLENGSVGAIFKSFVAFALVLYALPAIELIADADALLRAACTMRSRVWALGSSGKPLGTMALAWLY